VLQIVAGRAFFVVDGEFTAALRLPRRVRRRSPPARHVRRDPVQTAWI
jgi:hypothetical protein